LVILESSQAITNIELVAIIGGGPPLRSAESPTAWSRPKGLLAQENNC
jgi:hypothetical protein